MGPKFWIAFETTFVVPLARGKVRAVNLGCSRIKRYAIRRTTITNLIAGKHDLDTFLVHPGM
jgi:hypothetical protein